jgi:hypothetical protein
LGQLGNPADGRQQHQTTQYGNQQAQLSHLGSILLRQFARQNGDKDHVINAQHNLKEREAQQTNIRLRIGQKFNHEKRQPLRSTKININDCKPNLSGA